MTRVATVFRWCIVVVIAYSFVDLSATILAGKESFELWWLATVGNPVRPDSGLEDIDVAIGILWALHAAWCFFAIAAIVQKRWELFCCLAAGPACAVLVLISFENLYDPNWSNIVVLSIICWLVSLVITTFYAGILARRRGMMNAYGPKPFAGNSAGGVS